MRIIRNLLIALIIPVSLCAQQQVTVDIHTEYQTITGFGAFGGVKPYWMSPPFYSDPFLNTFLTDLGATIVRTNIFWDLEQTNDNTSASNTDLSKFNFKGSSGLAGQIPYYKALKAAGLKKLIATAWTPPVWMKLLDQADRIPSECYNCNNCPVGDPNRKVCGGRLNPVYYEEFAEYLAAYVKILKQEADVDLYAINIQNEPYFANPFEANVMRPNEYADVLKAVGRRFRKEGLQTKLFGPEHMAEWSWGVQQNYVNEILADPEVATYLDIYAVHSYVDGVAPDYGSADGWTALRDNISVAHSKNLWMTETSGYPQTIDGGMDLAASMYLALRFGNISAWVYWSVSDPASPSASSLMTDGAPTILHYISKQFFRYIRPGAIRVSAVSQDNAILPLAFKNPATGEMTLVMINAGETEKTMTLNIPVGPSSFHLYRTSASENALDAGTIVGDEIVLPARSVSTLVGSGPAGPSIDDIPDYYITAGQPGTIQIPIKGISDGSGGMVNVTLESSNDALATGVVSYNYPATNGTITLTVNTETPGKSKITVTLTNQNTTGVNLFSFNNASTSFVVEVIDVVTDVKKNEKNELTVFPNPVNGVVSVNISPINSSATVDIVDVKGNTVFHGNIAPGERSITVQTNQWQPGLYLINIQSEGTRTVKKLVVK